MSIWNTNNSNYWQKMKMLPFSEPTIFEQLPRFIFCMPHIVLNQKAKFESDDLFKKLSRESEVRYTGFRDKQLDERQLRFYAACREGYVDISFISTGTNFQLIFNPCLNGLNAFGEECDFKREPGKVHIKSCFIMNGVCIRWRGWIDLKRLEGVGCLEFDEERAAIEDARLREQIKCCDARIKELEDKQRIDHRSRVSLFI